MRRIFPIALLFGGMVFSSSGRIAFAQEECVEPPIPRPVDGASVSEDQMRAASNDARNFMAQSDVYQACLAGALEAAKAEAMAAGKPLDPDLENSLRSRGAASQTAKEKVGAQINAAMVVYKKTHIK